MRARTRHAYAYNGLSPREFGERTGQSAAQVMELIHGGWFEWTEDEQPECLDISKEGSKLPTYKIHPSAVKRFFRERAATKKSA